MMEENAFLEFVGDTPATRLLDFFITGREFDYTLTELSKKAGVSWATLYRLFPHFLKAEVFIEVRRVGRAKLYKINMANPLVKKLVDFHDSVLLAELKKVEKGLLVEA